jgi:hypothetical protein
VENRSGCTLNDQRRTGFTFCVLKTIYNFKNWYPDQFLSVSSLCKSSSYTRAVICMSPLLLSATLADSPVATPFYIFPNTQCSVFTFSTRLLSSCSCKLNTFSNVSIITFLACILKINLGFSDELGRKERLILQHIKSLVSTVFFRPVSRLIAGRPHEFIAVCLC